MVGARVSDRYRVIEPRPHRDRGEWCAVMDNPNTEYSRDVVGALKERADAPSMMAKHASAQKEAMQEACLGALRRALPGASAETCMMALETAGWDVDKAHAQIKAFMGAAATVAGGGGSKKSSKKSKRKRRSGSDSDSDSDSSSGSSSSSSDRKKSKKSRKKDKKGKRSKKDKKDKKSKKDAKKHGSDAKKPSGADANPEPMFGARGFIKETDKYEKEGEFRAWLGEVKKLDVESLQKWEEKELFKEYAEDYNTATLPHEKFYHLEKWSREEAARRTREDPTGAKSAAERESFDDETERKREIAAERERREAKYKRDTYIRMKGDSGDLENLREQERLKELRKNAYNMGDTETVARVNKILAPDDPDAR